MLSAILLLLFLLIILLNIPQFQNMAKDMAIKYLNNKLQTTVRLHHLAIDFPSSVELDSLYVADQSNDTLLYSGHLFVQIDMLGLLSGNVEIDSVQLDDFSANISRTLPDTAFNFDYILKAFGAGEPDTTEDTSPSSMHFNIGYVHLSNIRLRYNDVVTGIYANLNLGKLETRFDKLSPDSLQFKLDSIKLKNVAADYVQKPPLEKTANEPEEDTASASILPEVVFAGLILDSIQLHYRDEVANMKADATIDSLLLLPEKIDLNRRDIRLKKLLLDHSAIAFAMNPVSSEPDTASSAHLETDTSSQWHVSLAQLHLLDNHFKYDDNSVPKIAKGIDYNHLDISHFVLLVSGLFYSPDSSYASIQKIAFREQSGFDLKQLKTEAVYTDHGAMLDHLLLQTSNSYLSRKLAISYPSLDALSQSPGEMGLNILLDSAILSMKDVAYFQPDLPKNKYLAGLSGSSIRMHGTLRGKLNDLNIDSLFMKAAGHTSVAVRGHISDILNTDKARFDIPFVHIASGRKDLQNILPKELLPESIRVPDHLAVTGSYKGSLQSFSTHLKLKSTDGNGMLKAAVKNIMDSVHASYDGEVVLDKIRLGRILKNDSLFGPVTLRAGVKGTGWTTQSMQAHFNGAIRQAVLKGYNYKNVVLKGRIENQKGAWNTRIEDPNLNFSLTANADFSDSIPSVDMKLNLKNANLYVLHLTPDSLRLKGETIAKIKQLDLNKPNGKITLNHWHVFYHNRNIQIDSVVLSARSADSNLIHFWSPLMHADISGNYKLGEAPAMLGHLMNEYMGDSTAVDVDSLSAWKMRINVQLVSSDLWQELFPDLTRFGGAHLKGLIRPRTKTLWFGGVVNPLEYSGISLDSVRLGIYAVGDTLHYGLATHAIENSAIDIPHFYLKGYFDSNGVLMDLKTKDEQKKIRYHLVGKLDKNKENYKFSLLNDSLMLNYSIWNIPGDNYISYDPEHILVHQLTLQNGDQFIKAYSDSSRPGNPLHIDFHHFRINTLAQMVAGDSLKLGGAINGKVQLDSIMTGSPRFLADLTLDTLSFNDFPIGTLALNANNRQPNTYAASMQLSGNENDLKANGIYHSDNAGSFDVNVNMNTISMKTLEAFSFGQIEKASGKLTGHFNIDGTMDAPKVNGVVNFDKAGFVVTALNNYFKLNNEHITFDPSGIHFNKFSILDSSNNKAVIDGSILTRTYDHFKFDLNLTADNYRILNIPEKRGAAYYGQVYISTDTKIRGDENLPKIDMNVELENNSDFTMAMVDENPELVTSNGVVEFFDPDGPVDSSQLSAGDSTRYSEALSGFDIAANIAIDTNALLNLVIDPVNGDNLKVKGKANLNFTLDPSGKMSLTGRYDLMSGSYNMSFEGVIKKKFDILRGSYIIWKGDPYAADMNITARYRVEAPALDLVQDQLTDVSNATKNRYKQQLPFDVLLHLEGELMHPDIHFELDMPEGSRQAFDGSVYTRIKQINTEPSEVNKQTLGLLVLGHFIADNPFQTAGGGGAGQMARQSASKILSQQLNRLAGSLIKGVDVNFDLESSQDYSSGTAQNKTNLNVGLSKSLFNDRTTIYVGGNIPLEGNNKQKASQIVGDVAVEYKLSKDGRYRLRAYRKNKYEGVIEGEFIETGLSFIIVMNYDKFKELFRKPAKASENE